MIAIFSKVSSSTTSLRISDNNSGDGWTWLGIWDWMYYIQSLKKASDKGTQ